MFNTKSKYQTNTVTHIMYFFIVVRSYVPSVQRFIQLIQPIRKILYLEALLGEPTPLIPPPLPNRPLTLLEISRVIEYNVYNN